nr:hypothetical protein [Tanacetum cinerariifolium]
MGRDTIQLENTASTISQEYLLKLTAEYGIPESLHPELPSPADPIVEYPKGKVGAYTKFSMDLFSLISAPNPAKVKTETCPRAAHEVPLLTATANRVIDMEDMTGTLGSSGTPSTGIAPVGNPPYTEVMPEPNLEKETVAMGALLNKRRRKRGPGEAEAHAPPKVLRKDHVTSHLSQSTLGGKSLAPIGIGMGSTIFVPATQETPVHAEGVSDLDLLAKVVVTKYPDSEKSTSFTSMVGSPGSIYQPGEKHIKNLKAVLEAEADMKDIVEAKNVELLKELKSLRVKFSDLQVSNHHLSQQVSTLQAQVMGEERIKAAFKEFKKYEDDRVSSRCEEIDARLDALSIDFHEELYPHMLTTIAGRRWVIEHGLRLAIMKSAESTEVRHVFTDVVSAGISKGMSEGLKHGVEHRKAKVDLMAIEAYDPEADTKYVAALHALKDLKYPLVDQLEKLKDSPIYVIMSSLYLEKEILLEDAITTNISRDEKKKKCRVVCRTHRVGSAHHARFDGIPVSVPTVAPQGLAILLADAATQTDITEDEASPKLLRSKFLPPMYNLDWP